MDPRGQQSNLGLSADGMVVDFGYEQWGEGRARFDLATLTLSADPPADGRTAPPVQHGLAVTDWINSTEPRLDGKPLPLEPYETSRSLAIASRRQALPARHRLVAARLRRRGRRAVAAAGARHRLGGEHLRRRPAGGRRLRRRHAALAPDGGRRRAAGALPARRRQSRWVAWTPEGYYAASPGRLRRARLAVNRGWDAPAEFFPVSSIKGFYKPEAIKLVLPRAGHRPRHRARRDRRGPHAGCRRRCRAPRRPARSCTCWRSGSATMPTTSI